MYLCFLHSVTRWWVERDGGATPCLLDEGSCTSRVIPWGLLCKCLWKGGCWGGAGHSLGLLDPMSSPIHRGFTKMAKCPRHRVHYWMLKCRRALASQYTLAEMLWSHSWWGADARSTKAWPRNPAVEMEGVSFPSPHDVWANSASEGFKGTGSP